MKGYKRFNADMTCNGFQYAKGETYEMPENEVDICNSGFHYCENPLDTLCNYPLIDNECNVTPICEIEAEPIDRTENKLVTNKIQIKAKLDLKGFISASIDFLKEKTSNFDGNLASSGDYSQIASSGYYSKIASSGDSSQIASSGYSSKIASSGDYSQIASSGYYSKIASSGYYSKIASSGDSSQIASSGYSSQIASSGDYSQIASSGYSSQIASSGYYSKIASSGYYSQIASSGDYSVIAGIGIYNKAKAKKGSWITLAEWEYREEINRRIPVCVKTEYVDGDRIKEDVFYSLIHGEFQEVDS